MDGEVDGEVDGEMDLSVLENNGTLFREAISRNITRNNEEAGPSNTAENEEKEADVITRSNEEAGPSTVAENNEYKADIDEAEDGKWF